MIGLGTLAVGGFGAMGFFYLGYIGADGGVRGTEEPFDHCAPLRSIEPLTS